MRHSRFAEPAAEATKRTAHAQVGQNGAQLFRGVGVGLGRDLAQLITAGRWQRHILEHVLDVVLQQLVRTVALASLHVLHHQVGELLDVAGRAKHDVGRQRGGLDLKHALIQDEVLAPQAQHVVLDGATRRAEVEQASGAVVDLEHGAGHISRRNRGVQGGANITSNAGTTNMRRRSRSSRASESICSLLPESWPAYKASWARKACMCFTRGMISSCTLHPHGVMSIHVPWKGPERRSPSMAGQSRIQHCGAARSLGRDAPWMHHPSSSA